MGFRYDRAMIPVRNNFQSYILILCISSNHFMKYTLSEIPHIKIMRAKNFEFFIQQVQIMVFVQFKQGFFLRKSQICRDTCNGIALKIITSKAAVYRLSQKSGHSMLDITANAFIDKRRWYWIKQSKCVIKVTIYEKSTVRWHLFTLRVTRICQT